MSELYKIVLDDDSESLVKIFEDEDRIYKKNELNKAFNVAITKNSIYIISLFIFYKKINYHDFNRSKYGSLFFNIISSHNNNLNVVINLVTLFLVENNTEPYYFDENDVDVYTPLMLAVYYNLYEVVKLLLISKNSYSEFENAKGNSALKIAKEKGYEKIYKLLKKEKKSRKSGPVYMKI